METKYDGILLRQLTHNTEFFGKVMPILKPEFFSSVGDQELFKLIQNHYKNYRNIPSLTELVTSVKNVPNVEIRNDIISSLQTVSKIEDITNLDFMIDETIKWVKDAMYYKALQYGSDGLMKKDDALKLKAQQIMDERAKVTIDQDLGLDFDEIDDMIEYYSSRNIGIRTQHKELNKRLGAGFLPGTLSVILAASGIGKSLLMTDLISGIFNKNKNILLVSLEMEDKEIMKRVHANAMDLPINSLLDLNKTEGELQSLDRPIISKDMIVSAYNKIKASGNCGKLFIKDYPAGSFSPLMLEQLVESFRIEKDITFDMVFVDYIGIMKSDLVSASAGLYSYVKSIGEETRAVAKKLNVPIVSASQLNRSATGNIDTADNSNVSDSMGTVMTADFMLFLLQNEEMKERKEIVCKVTKNRFAGITDTWIMGIDYEHMRFHDLLVQNPNDSNNANIPLSQGSNESALGDFGLVTSQKQKDAEAFGDKEVKDIVNADVKKIKKHDSLDKNPFDSELEDLYEYLGL